MMKHLDYENPTHKEQCIINAQTALDASKEGLFRIKDAEIIGGRTANWFVGTGTAELNEAYRHYWKDECVYNAVLEALKVTEAQAEALTDGYNRYWENK